MDVVLFPSASPAPAPAPSSPTYAPMLPSYPSYTPPPLVSYHPPDETDTGVKIVLGLIGAGVLGLGIYLVKKQLDANEEAKKEEAKKKADEAAAQVARATQEEATKAPSEGPSPGPSPGMPATQAPAHVAQVQVHAPPGIGLPGPYVPKGPYKPGVQVWIGESWYIADKTGHTNKPMSPQPLPPTDPNAVFRAAFVNPPPLPKASPPPSGVAHPATPTPSGVAKPPASTPSGIASQAGSTLKGALPVAQQAIGALGGLMGGTTGAGGSLDSMGSILGGGSSAGGMGDIGSALGGLGGMFGS